MAEEKRNYSRADRLISGDSGDPEDVVVEVSPFDLDQLIGSNLSTAKDLDLHDFFQPFVILFFIYLMNFFDVPDTGEMGLALYLVESAVIPFVYFILIRDLFARIKRKPMGWKHVGLVKPINSAVWNWKKAFLFYFLVLPILYFACRVDKSLYRYAQSLVALTGGGSVGYGVAVMGPYQGLLIVEKMRLYAHVLLFAPIIEEIWFRGIGLAGFMNTISSPFFSALFTSIVFGLLHAPNAMCFAFVFGMVLSAVRLRTGTLYIGMAIHLAQNLLGLFVLPGYFSYT